MPTSVLAVDESMSDEQSLLAQAFADITTPAAGTVITGTEDADTLLGATGNDTVYGLGGDDFIEVTLTGAVSMAVVDGDTGTNTLSIQGNWLSLEEVLPVSLSYDAAIGGRGWTFASGDSAVAFTNIFTQNTTTGFWQGTAQFASRSYQLLNDTTVNALVSYPEYPGDTLMVFMVEGGPSFVLSSLSSGWNLLTTDSYTVFGTQLGDVASLGSGADEIITQAGNDSISGGAGNDKIWAGDGNDSIDAGSSTASFGSDTVDGGSGSDWLFFSRLPAAVTVNLAEHTVSSTLGDMAITGIEKVTGSGFADALTGGDIANMTDAMGNRVTEWFRGNLGNDTISGGAGADFFAAADYFNNTADQGVVANLRTGIAADGRGGTDTLVNIDFLAGGAGNDSLVGGSVSRGASGNFYEVLRGMAGNDTLDGSNSASDGDYASEDRADYGSNTSTQAVNVNLATGTASDGLGGTDTLISIDQVYGGAGNDTLTGGSGGETFDGGAGSDSIDGAGGSDQVRFQQSTAAVVVNLSTLSLTVGDKTVAAGTADDGMGGTDTLVNIENVRGSDFDDYFRGSDDSSVRQLFSGDGGNDTIDGGAGIDIAGYGDVPLISGGITASLVANASGAVLVSDGKGGTDTLVNIEGLSGTNSADALTGSAGNDYLRGQGGSDTLDGGDGSDWAFYSSDPSRVTVNLQTGQATDGWNGASGVLALGGTDTLINIENAEGSDFNDSITGSDASNQLRGRSGNDTLSGGGGNDTLDGGSGIDTWLGDAGQGNLVGAVLSGDANDGWNLVLESGEVVGLIKPNVGSGSWTVQGTGDNYATLMSNIEFMEVSGVNANGAPMTVKIAVDNSLTAPSLSIVGDDTPSGATQGNDSLVGTSGNDTIDGLGGSDTLNGGAGDDSLNGGPGYDVVDYTQDQSGVVVNLQTQRATDGAAGQDTLVGFEEVQGSGFNDELTGSTHLYAERFEGGAGNDTIDGGAITDTLTMDNRNIASYVRASGPVTVDLAAGTSAGAAGNDVLRNINVVFGSASADVLKGSNQDAVAEFLEGGAGDDTIDGQGGYFDIAVFSTASSGVFASLATGIATGSGTGTDTLRNIEGLFGSNFADVLTGGSSPSLGSELFRGEGGNDTIDGGAGTDWAFFDTATSSAVVTLGGTADGSASDGLGGTDVLRNIEGVRGSAFNDTLTGSDRTDAIELFEGREGADVIDGKGGTDTVWYRNSRAGVVVDLSQGKASNDGYGTTDTLTNIENVYGSRDFNDSITGNSGANRIEGNGGYDTLRGGAGNDTLLGGDGHDNVEGGVGDDSLDGGANDPSIGFDWVLYQNAAGAVQVNFATGLATGAYGNDTIVSFDAMAGGNFDDALTGDAATNVLRGNLGNDSLDGGEGFDYADYALATGSVTVSLVSNTSIGFDGNDILTSIEGIRGGRAGDLLTGDANGNWLRGNGGEDTLEGGAGLDTADYYLATGGVSVSLESGTSSGADGADQLSGFENLRGSLSYGDNLAGDAGNNTIEGVGGNDTLSGAAGQDFLNGGAGDDLLDGGEGNDSLIGGGGNDTVLGGDGQDTVEGGAGDDSLDGGANDTGIGFDWVMYQNATGAVQVNLATGLATGADGNDTVTSFDAVAGGNFDDVLTGDGAARNLLRGNLGNDSLDGGDGFDYADYSRATGTVTVSLVTNTSSGFDGNDTLTSIEGIRGGSVGDLLTGDGNDNWLRGNGGDDTLEGGAGVDTADYYGATGSVSVSLESGTSSGADGIDQLSGFERLRGSLSYGDELAGDAGNNTIEGVGGNDTLSGGAGQDFLNGGAGDDRLDGGEGSDSLLGGSGDDMLRTASGIDTLDGGDGTDTMYAYGGNYLLTGATLTGDANAGWTLKAGDGVVMGVIKPNLSTGVWTAQSPGQSSPTLISNIEQVQLQGVDASGNQMVLSLAMTNSLTAPMLTLMGEPQTPVETALHGIVYDWKSHTLLDNVAVIAGGGAEPAEGDSAPIWFSNPTWDASGHASIEVWTHSATPFENAGFGLKIAGATGISFGAGALPKTAAGASAWSVVTNVADDVITFAGMGLGAPIAQTDFLLGTVSFEAGSAQNLALQLQRGEVGEISATPFGLTGSRALTTTAGEFSFSDLAPGSYGVYASRGASDSGNAVNSGDALAALKMAVGINPNPDPDGSGAAKAAVVSPYQFMAADVVGTDGRVTSADAFAILKMAADLPTAPSKAWMFVEEGRDFWNELTSTFSLDRNAAGWDHKIDASATGEVNLVGVLKGDVNGSWAAPAGSTDLDVVNPAYFDALTLVYGMPMAQFGFSTTSGFVAD